MPELSSAVGAALDNWPVALGIVLFILLSVYFVWIAPKLKVAKLPFTAIGEDRRAELENEFRKTNAQILGGLFVLIGIYFTAEELSLSRKAENFKALSEAIKLLGSPSPQQQMGALHILDQVGREDAGKRRAVVSILASFVRHATQHRAPDASSQRTSETARQTAEIKNKSIRWVSETALQIMGDFIGDLGQNCADVPIANLSGADLRKVRLGKVNLSNTNLTGVKFAGADLIDTNLTCTRLNGADFDGATLNRVIVTGAHLEDASFDKTKIYGVDFQAAVRFDPNQLKGAICEDVAPPPKSIETACGSEN